MRGYNIRISTKQVLDCFRNYQIAHPNIHIWRSLSWTLFEKDENGNWINEIDFKRNKDIYNYLLKK